MVILIGIVLILVTVGIVMLASTSSVQGGTQFHDPLYYVKRQAVGLVVGAFIALFAARVDYHYWKAFAIPLALCSLVLLALVLVPGIGLTVKGSSRWLRLGPVTFQPSELAKFSSVILIAWWMARFQLHAREFRMGLAYPLSILGLFLGLVFAEPDFGTTMLLAAVGMLLLFLGGARIGYLAVAGAGGATLFGLAILHDPVRLRRITAFLDPEQYARNEAFQLLNAIYAFVVGGGRGVGFGQSLQKHFYLPEAHTDFIFAIIGEELGIKGSLGVLVLFMGLFLCGLHISHRAPDRFGQLLGFGCTLMLTIQAAINMGVVTGSLPTKGLPLPFISFGGSSLVASMAMIGVLLNLARHAVAEEAERDARCIRDAAHRI
ncbi:MAG: putative lipid II flippase FtsW [Kiritimatiellae bacterium]|nr:putative lipid II flippase FtsW [Kiritimatiellia bacterium]